jgi:hypothetical protein
VPEPIQDVLLGLGRDGRRLLGGLDRSLARLLRVGPELLLRDLGEVGPRLDLLEGGRVRVHDLLRRAARQEDRLLVREACDEERLPGIPGGAGGLAGLAHLADLLEGWQVREGRIADDVAVVVEGAPGENRHGEAVLDERDHVGEVGGRGLVVDVGLAALEHQPAVAAALDPEHRVDLEPEHLEGEKRHQVERGGALRAVEEVLLLERAHVAVETLGKVGRQVDDAAGYASTGCQSSYS